MELPSHETILETIFIFANKIVTNKIKLRLMLKGAQQLKVFRTLQTFLSFHASQTDDKVFL